jgi:tetratricopeptide (TPR) repeat protein
MSNQWDEAQQLAQQGHYDKALATYEALLAEEPENTTLLYGLLGVVVRMNRYPDVITICERLAEAHRRDQFYSHAVVIYARAYAYLLKHVPHLKDRFNHLPSRLAETFEESGANYGPFIPDALATRGGREETEHALIELLRRVLEVDPNNPVSHQCLIDALIRIGNKEEAKKQRAILAKLLVKQERQA